MSILDKVKNSLNVLLGILNYFKSWPKKFFSVWILLGAWKRRRIVVLFIISICGPCKWSGEVRKKLSDSQPCLDPRNTFHTYHYKNKLLNVLHRKCIQSKQNVYISELMFMNLWKMLFYIWVSWITGWEAL